MRERNVIRIHEFKASLESYVEEDPITGDVTDMRDGPARRWSALLIQDPSPSFLRFFASPCDCHDCAAIFSGCVGILYPACVLRIKQTDSAHLESVLIELNKANRLPLAAIPNHPAEQFLEILLKTPTGRELYRSIALLFLRVRDIPELQSVLFHPSECDRNNPPIILTVDALNEGDPLIVTEQADDGLPEEDISDENFALLIRRLESVDAGDVFREVLRGDAHACRAIKENPGIALTALQRGDDALGLSTHSAAKVLEEVLDGCIYGSEARKMIDAYLTSDRQAKLLGALGDLDSITANIVGQNTLRLMLLHVLASPTTTILFGNAAKADPKECIDHAASRHNIHLYRIAMVIKDNPCYEQLLDTDLDSLSFRERLLVAIWVLADRPKFVDGITPDLFDDVRLDRDMNGGATFQIFIDDRRADLDIDLNNLTDQIAQIIG